MQANEVKEADMKFTGLTGDKLIVKVTVHNDHHHLEAWYNGKMLWYAHLFEDAISLWEGRFNVVDRDKGHVYITLGGG